MLQSLVSRLGNKNYNQTQNQTKIKMRLSLQNIRLLHGRQFLAVLAAVLLLCAMLFGLITDQKAGAATASTINFQARLMNASGSIAPDGNYNIEFKLYDTASSGGTAQGVCTGNCKWVETRTGADVVTVANGYVTVNLGSVTGFGAGINWDQDLWMTMRVGGTGTPSWDTEMSPRLKLTAVPYAFRAGQLATLTGANTSTLTFDTQNAARDIKLPDEDGVLCIRNSANCGFATGTAASYIQNGTTVQTGANFNIRSNAVGSVTGVLQGANGQTADLFNVQTWNGSVATTVFGVDNVGDLTVQNVNVAANKSITLASGTGTYTQTYGNTTGTAATFNVTDSASSGTTTVQGVAINLVGTNNAGGSNSVSGLVFGNVAAATNNAFHGIDFGTGFSDLLRYNGTPLISGTGIVQSAAISGSYTGITGVGTLTAGALGAGFTAVNVAQGGTGATTFTDNGIIIGHTTGALTAIAAGDTGQCLVGSTGNAPTWGTCATGTIDLQDTYDNTVDATPEIVLTSSQGVLTIQDATSALGTNLFEVQSNGGATTYFGVAATAVTLGSGVDLTLQGANAFISNNQTRTDGEAFGNNAILGANGTTALGANTTAGFAGSIAIGAGATTTAANQLVIGGSSHYINKVVIGNGVTSTSPQGLTVQSTSAATGQTNLAGADLTFAAGQSTGNAFGGSVAFQISAPGASGTSQNSLATVATLGGATGAALFQNAANSTQGFRVKNVAGDNTFVIDTENQRAGIGLTGSAVPGISSKGLEVQGAIRISGSSSIYDSYTTPHVTLPASISARLSVVNADLAAGQQIVALGVTNGSDATARGISILDARSGAHQPTISVFNPNEDHIGGFSWDGSNTAFLIKNTASGSIGLNVAGSTVLSATTAGVDITGLLSVSSLGSANTVAYLCRNGSNQISTCQANATGSAFVQGGNDFNAPAVLGTTDTDNLQFQTNSVVRATFDQSNALYLGNGVTAGTPNNFTISGTGSSTTGVAGGALTIQGGNATVGTANGGNVTISGGSGFGGGVNGLVVITTPTISTSSTQNCASSCSITQSNVDSTGAVLINATNPSLTVTLADPTITTAGRIMYVTNVGANDFTLSVNGGGTGNTIAMKPNTTATMIWNGSDWTAAGASSSTDLQSAYNNTLTSAGGAELVLNAPGGSADGLTIRNNATTPIVGGILEVQTSIGSSLLSVNNNATEYATNGGAETVGASSSTFPSNTWDTTTGGTVDRWTTTGDDIATGQASVRVQTTAANHGARNRLSAALTSGLTYTASFAVRDGSNFSTLQILYSPDGTTTGTTQCATGQTVTSGIWRRITCSFVASGTITTSNSILIRQTDATARTFYVDNLSVNTNASATFAADGSVDDTGSFSTNWTNYAASGTSTVAQETSTIYDTSGSARAAVSATAGIGLRNNLAITPQTNTQYLVTFYMRSTTTMTGSVQVGFLPAGGTGAPSGSAACIDYNTQSLAADTWTEITCLFTTDSTTITNPDLVVYQSDAAARTIYVDALSITLNTNNSNNVQIGGANKGGPVTLFTLDRSNGAPIAANNEAYLGSMYYDTDSGRIQCYEADGWGACGAAPDNIVNLNPEYAGAVLNGSGIGTMTADFCSNDTALTVNSSLCSTGEAKNFYKWTSPQASQQTYSIYVTYQLPATFNGFANDDTVQLVARVDNTSNASVTYEMFKSTGSAVTQCGASETNVITGGGGSANTWYSYGINGNEATGCSFNSSSAGDFIIFKINLKASGNSSAYVSTLSFTTTGR